MHAAALRFSPNPRVTAEPIPILQDARRQGLLVSCFCPVYGAARGLKKGVSTHGNKLVIEVAKMVRTLMYRVSVRFSTGTGSAPRLSRPAKDSLSQMEAPILGGSKSSRMISLVASMVPSWDDPVSRSRAMGSLLSF